MARIPEKQEHLAENTRETVLILILKIRPVTPFENQYLECVLSGVQLLRYPEFACHMAYLTVTDKNIVHPKIKAGVHALKIHVNLASFKAGSRNVNLAPIERRGIFVRNMRGIDRERIVAVCIVRCIISAVKHCLPAARNGHFFKLRRCVKALRGKIINKARLGIKSEIPVTAQRHEPLGSGAPVSRLCRRSVGIKRDKICARRLTAYMKYLL